jgi:phospholipid-binding lipoprotein MlaA
MTLAFSSICRPSGGTRAVVGALLVAVLMNGMLTTPVRAEEAAEPPIAATAMVESADAAVDVVDPFAEENLTDPGPLNGHVADPLEPVNRVFFAFNDKLYFWVLKPVSKGYALVVPKVVRECAGNFFFNLKTPVRLVNTALQAKFNRSGVELARFAVNTTVGGVGLWDPARSWLKLSPSDEDFGQTLGKYGVGEGLYLCWPVFGPANLRDSLGLAGDYFLDPVSYLYLNHQNEAALEIRSGETVNRTSLRLGDYEAFKEASFDPYSAMRDSYTQSRRSKINDEPDK